MAEEETGPTALNLPPVDPLPDDTQAYFDLCAEKLGLVPNVLRAYAFDIEKLNAFIACANPGAAHSPAFMICRECDSVAETQSMPSRGALGDAAKAAGFVIEKTVVEAEGLCPTCVDKATP